jgi:prepilin-type N-terminal cleavage/methylation domain-containing protein
MSKINNKSGFTLIEIIVVLIIVGILASIALPSLFSNVARSRVAEGLAGLSTYKSQTEGCVQAHYPSGLTSCTWALLNLAGTSGNFNYTFTTAPSNSTYAYAIQAVNITYPGDTVTLTRAAGATGGYTCLGAGNYTGAC